MSPGLIERFERWLFRSSDIPPDEEPPALHASRRRLAVFLFTSLVGIVTLFIILVVVPIAYTSTNSFCQSCHTMDAVVASWKVSTHSKVNCIQCHVKPGAWNQVVHKGQSLKEVYIHFFGEPKLGPGVGRPGNENCLNCHTADRKVSASGDLIIPHKQHIEFRNLKCADCHSLVVHGAPGNTLPSMDFCYMCHDGKNAPNSCETCHKAQAPPPTHVANFIETHGAIALQNQDDCLRCHTPSSKFCEDCHSKRPPSHTADWQYSHGAVTVEKENTCYECHDKEEFCNTCHKIDHPADWLQTHPQVAKANSDTCLPCHSHSFCEKCHSGTDDDDEVGNEI
ncbi:MAG: NapC/NirT family cytochrome c [Actinobacteria bacterium]|nr:NapC/NirT family cytochrome c [Actinomycetota bacterium]